MQRVAAIGLDAAEPALMDDLIAQDRLPVLARFREGSRRFRLSDDLDYRTGIVWEHFLTGRGARSNGRTSVVEFDPATYETVAIGARPLPRFFDGDQPIPALLFDIPYTSLAAGDDTAAVTAWGGHDSAYPRASHPRGLLREIDRRFGPHPALGNDYTAWWYQPAAIKWLERALIEGARRRGEIIPWLLGRFPDHRLFATVFSEPHSAGEFFWHGVDADHLLAGARTAQLSGRALAAVYESVDAALGRVLASLSPECAVMIFSTHGIQSNSGDLPSMVLLPELLNRAYAGSDGRGRTDVDGWRRAGFPPLEPDPRLGWDRHLRTTWLLSDEGWRQRLQSPSLNPVFGAALALRSRLTANPRFVRSVGRRPIEAETDRTPEQIGQPRFSQRWQVPCAYQARWPEMKAFALPTFYDGRVRINLRGRESRGVVTHADYGRVCDEVEAMVRECRDVRSGRPVVDTVVRLRADDPLARDGPDADLVFTWHQRVDAWRHPTLGSIGPFPLRRTGGHSPNGFAYLRARGVSAGCGPDATPLDVPATLVDLLDHRPSMPVEGRSLLNA